MLPISICFGPFFRKKVVRSKFQWQAAFIDFRHYFRHF